MEVLFLMSIFRLYAGLKMLFEYNSVRKNLFLIACLGWASKLPLGEMDQNYNFDGTIGYGDSYLEFSFRQLKVLWLQA